MKSSLRLSPICLLPLALAACQEEKKAPSTGTAQGEILPGSASDAMLPLDTVRSQPPLAPIEVASGKPGKAPTRGSASGAAGGAEADDEAEAPPAAVPSIAAETVQ